MREKLLEEQNLHRITIEIINARRSTDIDYEEWRAATEKREKSTSRNGKWLRAKLRRRPDRRDISFSILYVFYLPECIRIWEATRFKMGKIHADKIMPTTRTVAHTHTHIQSHLQPYQENRGAPISFGKCNRNGEKWYRKRGNIIWTHWKKYVIFR